MFIELKRVKFMWDQVLNAPPNEKGFRINRNNQSIVHYETDLTDLNQVPRLFDELKMKLAGRCVDLQFVFNGPCPIPNLRDIGFLMRKDECRIFNLPHFDYRVAAIAIDSTNSWILELIKRTNQGILQEACYLDFLIRSGKHQISLFEKEAVV